MINKHWNDYHIIYQIVMSNYNMPFYYDENKLYLVTSWSMGSQMLKASPEIVTTIAKGIEILSYGN